MKNALLGFLLLLGCAAVQAQSKTGTITGRVMDESGQPLAGATVSASSALAVRVTVRSAPTDEDGRFQLTGLSSGAFLLSASSPAYVMKPMLDAAGEPRYVRDGDVVAITMARGGVITGRVLDASGEPIAGMKVQATRTPEVESRSLPRNLFANGFATRTDDRGVYRIFGLPAGAYVVGTDGADSGWSWNADEYAEDAPTYHPNSTRDGATALTVAAGEERTDIDIRYRGERGRTVSGQFSDSGSTGIVYVELLKPGTGTVIAFSWQSIWAPRSNQNVGFDLRGIPDGEYDLVADRRDGEDDGATSPRRRITVSGADVTGIALRLTPYASVSGKLQLVDGPVACPAPPRGAIEETAVTLLSEAPPPPPTESAFTSFPTPQSEFRIRYLLGGRYRLRLQPASEDWYVRAIARPAQKLDLARTGISLKAGEQFKDVLVTLSTGAAGLQGTLKAAARVHLVPVEKEAADDPLRYFETDTVDGGFAFRNLPPGKYWLLARTPTASEAPRTPLAWDAAARAQLRRDAEAANQLIDLSPCARVKGVAMRMQK